MGPGSEGGVSEVAIPIPFAGRIAKSTNRAKGPRLSCLFKCHWGELGVRPTGKL